MVSLIGALLQKHYKDLSKEDLKYLYGNGFKDLNHKKFQIKEKKD